MANTLKIIYHPITSEAIGVFLEGEATFGHEICQGFSFIQVKLGELVNGKATLALPNGVDTGDFTFAPKHRVEDPAEDPGRVNYDEIAGHFNHIIKDHGEPAPTRELTQAEKDLNAQAGTLAFLLGRHNTIYNKLSLDITTDADGLIIHHEFKCEKTDGSEAIWVPNPIIGLIQKPNEKPCALLQFFDGVNDLVGEVRCEVGTNELLGFRKIIANGIAKTRSYTAAQAETFLHETEAAEAKAAGGE